MAFNPSTALRAAELARELGVSRQAIHDLGKRGIIAPDENGRYDLETVRRAIAENMTRSDSKTLGSVLSEPEPEADPAAPADASPSFHAARTLRETYEAGLAKLKLEQAAGSLIDRDSYERAAFTAARQLRDALVLTFPQKYAARLAPLTDPWDLEQSLRRFLADELGALAANLRELIQSPPDEPPP